MTQGLAALAGKCAIKAGSPQPGRLQMQEKVEEDDKVVFFFLVFLMRSERNPLIRVQAERRSKLNNVALLSLRRRTARVDWSGQVARLQGCVSAFYCMFVGEELVFVGNFAKKSNLIIITNAQSIISY